MIKVWKFKDAPVEYRDLFEGSDADWLAFVPDSLCDEWINWLESGSAFGCCDVVSQNVEGGQVRVGYHS